MLFRPSALTVALDRSPDTMSGDGCCVVNVPTVAATVTPPGDTVGDGPDAVRASTEAAIVVCASTVMPGSEAVRLSAETFAETAPGVASGESSEVVRPSSDICADTAPGVAVGDGSDVASDSVVAGTFTAPGETLGDGPVADRLSADTLMVCAAAPAPTTAAICSVERPGWRMNGYVPCRPAR